MRASRGLIGVATAIYLLQLIFLSLQRTSVGFFLQNSAVGSVCDTVSPEPKDFVGLGMLATATPANNTSAAAGTSFFIRSVMVFTLGLLSRTVWLA